MMRRRPDIHGVRRDRTMRNIALVIFFFAASVLPFEVARAGSPGTTAMNFLKLEVGARQASMGGGGAALGDDINADRHNPGGLGLLTESEASFLVSSYLQGVTYEHAAGAVPTAFGTVGLQFTQFSYGTFSGYDPNNNYTGSVDGGDTAVGFSYGRTLGGGFSAGGTFRYLREKLNATTASGDSFDGGVLYRPQTTDLLMSKLSLGFTAENLGPSVGYIQENARLPQQFVLGAGLIDYKHLTVYTEMHAPNDNNPYETLGAEYWWDKHFAARLGYRTGTDVGSGVSVGGGLRFGNLQFDYAWIPYSTLGNVNQFGLVYRFAVPTSKDAPPKPLNILPPPSPTPEKPQDPNLTVLRVDLSTPVAVPPVVAVSTPVVSVSTAMVDAVPQVVTVSTLVVSSTLVPSQADRVQEDLHHTVVYFSSGTFELLPVYTTVLSQVAAAVKEHPASRVRAIGYSDNIGNAGYNLDISWKRARAVKRFLVASGLSATRISIDGKGPADPIASNDTSEGREANRRVDLLIRD